MNDMRQMTALGRSIEQGSFEIVDRGRNALEMAPPHPGRDADRHLQHRNQELHQHRAAIILGQSGAVGSSARG